MANNSPFGGGCKTTRLRVRPTPVKSCTSTNASPDNDTVDIIDYVQWAINQNLLDVSTTGVGSITVDDITISNDIDSGAGPDTDTTQISITITDDSGTNTYTSNISVNSDNQTASQVPFDSTACPELNSTEVQSALCALLNAVKNIDIEDNGNGTFNLNSTLPDGTVVAGTDIDVCKLIKDGACELFTFSDGTNTLIVKSGDTYLYNSPNSTIDFTQTTTGLDFDIDLCTAVKLITDNGNVVLDTDKVLVTDGTNCELKTIEHVKLPCNKVDLTTLGITETSTPLEISTVITTYVAANDCGPHTNFEICDKIQVTYDSLAITYIPATVGVGNTTFTTIVPHLANIGDSVDLYFDNLLATSNHIITDVLSATEFNIALALSGSINNVVITANVSTDCTIYMNEPNGVVTLIEQPSVAAVSPSITDMCDPANSDAVVYILVDADNNFTYQNADNTPWTGDPLTLEKCCCEDSPNTQDLTSISWRIDGNKIGLDYIDENQDTTSESITCEEFKTFLASCPDTHSIKVLNPDGTDKSCPLVFPFTLTDATEITSQVELDTWVNTNRVGYTWEDATCSYVNTTGEPLKDIATGEWICDISTDCCRITSTASFTAATPTIRVIDNTTGQIIFNGSNGSIITYDYVGNAALALNGTGIQISGFGLAAPTVAEIRITLNNIINPVTSCNGVTQIRSNITDFDTQNSSNRSSTLFDYDNYFYFNVGNRMQNTTGIEWEAIVPNDNGALVGVVQTEGVQNYGSDFGLVISNIGTVAETGEAIGFQIFTWTHEMVKKCYLSNTGMSVYRYEDTSSNTVLESDIVCTPFQTQTKIN